MNKKDIKNELQRFKVECVWMENAEGTTVFVKNAVNKPIGPHLDAIFRTFESRGMPNGQYYLCAKHKFGSREGATYQYPMFKGPKPEMSEGPVLQDRHAGMPMQNNAPTFSPMEFIQLNADLAAAKAENTIYRQQIARLESELAAANERADELQDKLDDREPVEKDKEKGFAEQASSFMAAAAPFAPIIAALFTKGIPDGSAMPAIPAMPAVPVMQENNPILQTNEKTAESYNQGDIDDLGRIKMLFQRNPEAFDRFVADNYELGGSEDSDESEEYEYARFNDTGSELNEENDG
jgi:hypothetical protein